MLSDKCFWAKVNEEQLESQDFFADMKRSFGAIRSECRKAWGGGGGGGASL